MGQVGDTFTASGEINFQSKANSTVSSLQLVIQNGGGVSVTSTQRI